MITFIRTNMIQWKRTLKINQNNETFSQINISSGISWGLSHLFCISLASLSSFMSKSGYMIVNIIIKQLVYIDYLCQQNDEKQKNLLTTMKRFSDSIKIEFNLEKSAEATFERDKLTESEDIKSDRFYHTRSRTREKHGNIILWWNTTLKYENIRIVYYKRIRLMLKSVLNITNTTSTQSIPL